MDGIYPLHNLAGTVAAVTTKPALLLVLVPLVSIVLWYVTSYLASPLRRYPGPPLAAWTNYWRMYHAHGGSMHVVSKKLHDKYGPVVRMAPNYLDLDYSSLIKTCFDRNGVWRKTEWHGVSGVKMGPHIFYNIFSETDPVEHARIKKPIAKYFTTSGVLPMEPHVDTVLSYLVKQLEKKSAEAGQEMGAPFDFGEWVMYYAWDVVGQATFGKPIGYLEHGCDFDGTLKVSEKAMHYLVTIGMQYKLDNLLDKNPIFRIGPPSFGNITAVAMGHLMSRYAGTDGHDAAQPDFLDRYIEAKKLHPDDVDDNRILSYLLVNLAAGADTTAVSLKSVFYLSVKHPRVWKRLQADILAAPFASKGTLHLPAPYAQTRAIPYLEAVIREALRLYPGNCFPQERYVPAGGLRLPDGSLVAEGTAVGFNAYVLHRNKEVWGEDAEEFRPERFLRGVEESEEEFKARMTRLNNCDLSFGEGSRKCIGMNLGMMEVYKTVATLIARFEFELADPEAEWTIHNRLFPAQSGVIMRIRRRPGMRLVDE